MRLEAEGSAPINQPTEKQVRSLILKLRSYGPRSFASLTDEFGNYVQVAGGGVTCLLERRDATDGRHFRAFHDRPSSVFPDGTTLVFSGGQINLAADEWFTAAVVADAFCSFLKAAPLPAAIGWRDVTQTVSA